MILVAEVGGCVCYLQMGLVRVYWFVIFSKHCYKLIVLVRLLVNGLLVGLKFIWGLVFRFCHNIGKLFGYICL